MNQVLIYMLVSQSPLFEKIDCLNYDMTSSIIIRPWHLLYSDEMLINSQRGKEEKSNKRMKDTKKTKRKINNDDELLWGYVKQLVPLRLIKPNRWQRNVSASCDVISEAFDIGWSDINLSELAELKTPKRLFGYYLVRQILRFKTYTWTGWMYNVHTCASYQHVAVNIRSSSCETIQMTHANKPAKPSRMKTWAWAINITIISVIFFSLLPSLGLLEFKTITSYFQIIEGQFFPSLLKRNVCINLWVNSR